MKLSRIRHQQWAMLIVAGCAMAGNPHPVQAMSLLMGGEEPIQSAPPSKAVVNKPKPSEGKPVPPAATPAVNAPGKAVQGVPAPVAGSPGPVASTPAIQGQQSPASGPVSKPAEVQQARALASPVQDIKSAKETMQPAPSPPLPKVEVAPASPEAEGYTYDPKSRRDPFQSLTRLVKVDRTRMELPPLQRVQLSDVKLLGIIWGGYGYYALVRTPDGKGYTVKEGMLMGTNSGVISTITNTAVTVSEPSIDMAGNKSTKDIVILLRPKEVS